MRMIMIQGSVISACSIFVLALFCSCSPERNEADEKSEPQLLTFIYFGTEELGIDEKMVSKGEIALFGIDNEKLAMEVMIKEQSTIVGIPLTVILNKNGDNYGVVLRTRFIGTSINGMRYEMKVFHDGGDVLRVEIIDRQIWKS